MSKLEQFNEVIILAATYFNFLYSDGLLLTKYPESELAVKNTILAQDVAWAHIALIALIIGVNMIAMLLIQAMFIKRKVRLFYAKLRFMKKQ